MTGKSGISGRGRLWLLAAVLWLGGVQPLIADGSVRITQDMFPRRWRLEKTYAVAEPKLEGISARLGGKVTAMKNYVISAGKLRLQVNVIDCATRADAEGIHARLLILRQDPLFCDLQGMSVIEYVCDNLQLVKKADSILGLTESETFVWEINTHVAPLRKLDYMKWNELYVLLDQYSKRSARTLEEKILSVSQGMQFGTEVSVRTGNLGYGAARFSFDSKSFTQNEDGEFTQYAFEQTERILGIPRVRMQAIIPVRAFSSYQPEEPVNTRVLTAGNEFWPTDHPQIKMVAKVFVKRNASLIQNIEALLKWVSTHVTYGGAVEGSRYGVETILRKHRGRCWDFSDMFITLCRAAGIPARQIVGWLKTAEGFTGHVWAEVYAPEEGWIAIDPTTTWMGVSDDYIPLFVSEDGTMPVVYWEKPSFIKVE